jgi:hypothetical protein
LIDNFMFPDVDDLCKFRRNMLEEVIFLDQILKKSMRFLRIDKDTDWFPEDWTPGLKTGYNITLYEKEMLLYVKQLHRANAEVFESFRNMITPPYIRWEDNFYFKLFSKERLQSLFKLS